MERNAFEQLDQLATEGARRDLIDLDTRTSTSLVRLFAQEQRAVAEAVDAAAPSVARLADHVAPRVEAGGRLVYVGAGSAGRIAALDAAECAPTFGVDAGLVTAVVAGGAGTMVDAREGLEDDVQAAVDDLAPLGLGPLDTVLGVTASGRTPYVLSAVTVARRAGASTAGLVSNERTPLADAVDLCIEVLTGPEVIAGSTRLKAGSAQKTVLNALSTLVMVRLGRTYGPWMVAVRPSNDKLRRRVVRALVEAAGATHDEACTALDAADGDARCALVALRTGLPVPAARERLDAAGGRVASAIARHGG